MILCYFFVEDFFSVFGSLVAEVKSVFLFISSYTGMLAISLLELIGTYRSLAEFYRSLSGFLAELIGVLSKLIGVLSELIGVLSELNGVLSELIGAWSDQRYYHPLRLLNVMNPIILSVI